jgi:hypothetical protein
MSKEKVVITVKDESLPISKCRQFDKKWYKIGDVKIENSGDCYFIKNRYYREETGSVVFNYSINEYVLKDDSVIKGIINIDENNIVKFGYFNYDKKHAVIKLENGSKCNILNEECLLNNKLYREILSTGEYSHISLIPAKKFNSMLIPKQEYKHSLPYDSKGITNQFLSLYNNNYNPKIFENVSLYSKVLGDLTFGLEFETTKGFIPERIINNYGLIPLRDGSISGIEYVTVPLQSEKGLQYVIDISKILEHRTVYDKTCSLHQHIGNLPRTKEFILSFFKLTCAIQDEIFEMFPLFKKYNFRVKNKNYSKPYPIYNLLSQMDSVINTNNIDENFNILYKYLSSGQEFKDVGSDLDNVTIHPSDPNGNQKWLIKNRYYIHNMIPLIFGNKQTIEFRIHTPTYDVNKIVPFMFINSILINYTIQNQNEILGTRGFLCNKNLSNIITEYLNNFKFNDGGNLHASLLHYINSRKTDTESQNIKGNIVGDETKIRSCNFVNWTKEVNEKKFVSDPYEVEIKRTLDYIVKGKMSVSTGNAKISFYRQQQKDYRNKNNLSPILTYEE